MVLQSVSTVTVVAQNPKARLKVSQSSVHVLGNFNKKPDKGQNQEISQRKQTSPDKGQGKNYQTGKQAGKLDNWADRRNGKQVSEWAGMVRCWKRQERGYCRTAGSGWIRNDMRVCIRERIKQQTG